MAPEIPKLALPFSVLAPERNEPFSFEAEKAAIFCLCELERGKGGKILGKQPPERIDFIAKVFYPLWLVPFRETDMIFDGLNTISYTLSYPPLPDIQTFIDGLDRTSTTRQVYMSFLSDNANLFQTSKREDAVTVEALIVDVSFREDFNLYLSETEPLDTLPQGSVFLPSTINETSISTTFQELDGLKSKFITEVSNLNKSMKLLHASTQSFVQTVQSEIQQVRKAFEEILKKRSGPVEEQIKEIRKTCDAEITLVSKKFDKELLQLQKAKVEKEKARDQFSRKIERADVEIRTSSGKKDDAAKKRWKIERDRLKKERSSLESETKKLEKQINSADSEKSQELFRLRSDCDSKIQEVTKELLEIESARDAKVQILTREIEKTQDLSSSILKQLDSSSKQRETSITAFEKYGIPRKYDQSLLAYMPLYLVSYRYGQRRRYVHFPPSTVNSVKLSVRLKGALGVMRIKQLFSPRSTAIASFLNRFPLMMEEDAAFEREVSEAASKLDLLKVKDSKETIRNGLETLKEEGWLSEKEYASFVHRLI